jgi:4-diphosphocytidyl-2-C-methyl-D-erythritol kinase
LLKLDLSPEDLRRGALALGADVPFFLLGGTAVGEGIGERLTWVDLPVDYGLLLVNPGFPVSTGMIFREYSKTLTGQLREGTLWRMIREKRPLESFLHNDLQVVAERLYPEISEMCARLVGFGIAASLMTGSGPTVFGIGDPDRLDALKRQLPGQWLRLTARPVKRGVAID